MAVFLPTVFTDKIEGAGGVMDTVFAKKGVRAATVVAIGPGKQLPDGTRVPMPPLKAGQKVVIGPQSNGVAIPQEVSP